MLSIVSTPIGNLGDITLRALETLKSCDAIVCEDTRVTGKLLSLLGLPKKELLSFHSFNEHQKLTSLISRLKSQEHLALVSDAGTPGISDPGYLLIAAAQDAGLKVEVIPGPAAFLAALSVSGLPIHDFVYVGFLPLKKGRQTLLGSLHKEERTVVFYESPHRIEKTLSELRHVFSDQPDRTIVLCRELTKMHEEVMRMTIADMKDRIPLLTIKGEFCVIIGPRM
jgi:16S rRNA (cytidine1402-2'-O)-methyltransferase